MSQDLTDRTLISEDLVGLDLMSRDLTGWDLISRDLITNRDHGSRTYQSGPYGLGPY
jgi:hypothetical protein